MSKRRYQAVESLDDGLDYAVDDYSVENETNDPEASGTGPKANKRKKKDRNPSKFGNPAIALANTPAQVAFFNQKLKLAFKGITELELATCTFTDDCILNSSSFDKPRTTSNIGAWLKEFSKVDLERKFKTNPKGSPRILIITCENNRAKELIKHVQKATSVRQVASLHARKVKVAEQAAFLKKGQVDFAIGTPTRMLKLTENKGALKMDRVELVIIDCFRDAKDRMVVDMPGCFEDLFTLFRECFFPNIMKNTLQVALY
ncbi:cms1 ribosomal small subunit [Dimargaris cristalligena]|nr:cms1 ribosomal small subunit [Dimargaris cristalligena]